jgi:hypothetical protein
MKMQAIRTISGATVYGTTVNFAVYGIVIIP